jgi:type I restriction enzyme R subunit
MFKLVTIAFAVGGTNPFRHVAGGWDIQTQIREEVGITAGRIIVRGKMHKRGPSKRADYVLYYKSNIQLAVIEAKDNNHSVGSGIQQAIINGEII